MPATRLRRPRIPSLPIYDVKQPGAQKGIESPTRTAKRSTRFHFGCPEDRRFRFDRGRRLYRPHRSPAMLEQQGGRWPSSLRRCRQRRTARAPSAGVYIEPRPGPVQPDFSKTRKNPGTPRGPARGPWHGPAMLRFSTRFQDLARNGRGVAEGSTGPAVPARRAPSPRRPAPGAGPDAHSRPSARSSATISAGRSPAPAPSDSRSAGASSGAR